MKSEFIEAFKNTPVRTFFGILQLLLVLFAVWLGYRAMNYADNQVASGSRLSDSLFAVQLKYAKAQNDSLLNRILEMQKVTKQHLLIADIQSKTLRESLNEKLSTSRPKFAVLSIKLSDSSSTSTTFSPEIATTLRNVGERNATGVTVRPFVMFADFSGHRQDAYPGAAQNIEPGRDLATLFSPKMPSKHRNDFYFFFELTFRDAALKRVLVQTFFYRCNTAGDRYDFHPCENEEKGRLLMRINEVLNKGKQRLLSGE